MNLIWLRRALFAAVCVASGLLSGCGSGTIESALRPTRFIAFGDGMSDVGNPRLTVNDGSVNTWVEQVAARYGQGISSSATGGRGYARAHARVTLTPDAAGNTATFTLRQQIDTFLAGDRLANGDVVLINGGTSDIIAQMAALRAGSQTEAQTTANIRQAGRDLGAQVRRLVVAGGRNVIVAGSPNLGTTPWATSIGRNSYLNELSRLFNEEMLISIVDLGTNVLYVDTFFYFNLVTASPASFALQNAVSVACNSADAGPGIGIGRGLVNSALCTPSTIIPNTDYNLLVYADAVYFTPAAQRLFGDNAFSRITSRF